MRIKLLTALSLVLSACAPTLPPANDDAGYGRPPDLSPPCSGDNDGTITRAEINFALDIPIRYLTNPGGTTVGVAPDGKATPGGPEWDLTSTAGDVLTLLLEPVQGQWFANAFPTGTYATLSDVGSDTLGIFRVTDTALQLLGFASRAAGQTLLVYDTPVDTMRFPLRKGDGWVTGARIVNGTLNGQPFASTDTYKTSVDARGTAVLPFLTFQNTLRLHVDLAQTLPGGVTVSRVQHLFLHECYGELGRMVSSPGDTNPSFATAAEFRRLAL